MPIKLSCQGCGKQYTLKDELAGKTIRCPNCKKPLAVPGVPAAQPDSARLAAKPPQQASGPRRPASKSDPDATVFQASPRPHTQDLPGSKKKDSAPLTTCPACGKSMPVGTITCRQCGYNVKLRRRLSLTDALKKTDVAPGMRADGSRYVTRGEKATIRQSQGKKLRNLMIAVAAIVVLLAAGLFLYIRHTVYWGQPLEELRLSVLPRIFAKDNPDYIPDRALSNSDWFHPYTVGMKVEAEAPLAQICVEQHMDLADEKHYGLAAASFFAEKCRLPFAKTDRLIQMPRVEVKLAELGGSFAAAKLEPFAKLENNTLVVWRKTNQSDQSGYLSGAVLDLGDRQAAFIKELQDAAAKGKTKVKLEGKLSCLVSDLNQMQGGDYTYAQSLRLDLRSRGTKVDKIVPAPEGKSPVEKQEKHEELMPTEAMHFHPIVIVGSYAFE